MSEKNIKPNCNELENEKLEVCNLERMVTMSEKNIKSIGKELEDEKLECVEGGQIS